jgi:hypothetical protein
LGKKGRFAKVSKHERLRKTNMENLIPFEEGEYLVEQAFLVAPDNSAVELNDTVIKVYMGPQGKHQINGISLVRNVLLVELLESCDDVDLVLNLGEEFKYILKKAVLKAGKVFAPDVKSMLQFFPSKAWEKIPQAEFENLLSQLKFLAV